MDHIDLAFCLFDGGYTGKCSEKGYCSGSCESSIDDGKHSDPFGGSFVLQESVASFIQDQDTVRIALVLLSKISYFLLVNY